nr:MAG TPA: hypothetical protein [Bacteriophage sp.]
MNIIPIILHCRSTLSFYFTICKSSRTFIYFLFRNI